MHKVTLWARIRKGEGSYAFERVVTEKKGKKGPEPIQPMEPADATRYYFRFSENGKQHMKSVSENFQDAVRMLRNREAEIACAALGVAAPASTDARLTVAQAADKFETSLLAGDKSSSTVSGYKRAVAQFRESCFKVYMDEITEWDIMEHVEWLKKNVPTRAHGQRNGMIFTRLSYLSAFFFKNGLKFPWKKKEWPQVDETNVEAYTSEQIQTLLSQATPDEYDLILFFLCTGFRDDEAAHSVYDDVNFKAHTVKVCSKPEFGFRTKNRKERVVPVPADLIERLRERRERDGAGPLIFPNGQGKPDNSLLARVRKAAARVGFTGRVTLHKFRKTFGTRYGEKHRVRNAQLLLGHESIVTTEKYLAQTKIARSAVESLFEDVVGK